MEVDNERFEIIVDRINEWFACHGINVQINPLTLFAIIAVLFVIVFFVMPAGLQSAKHHKWASGKSKRCTHSTIGKVVGFDVVERVMQDRDHSTYIIRYAKVRYMDFYEVRVGELPSRELMVGDGVKIWYDPQNPKDAIADADKEAGLNDRWYVGILEALGTLAIFVTIVLGIMCFTGYFKP